MNGLPMMIENDVNKLKTAKLRAICSTPCKSTSRTDTRVWVQPETDKQNIY